MLAVDIGNSQTVLGLFREGKLTRKWRLTTITNSTSDEIEFRVRGFLEMHGLSTADFDRCVVATVVPALDRPWRKALERMAPAALVTSLHAGNCGIPLSYSNPAQIGPDRLANALAVERLGLQDAIVIDLGTATTFDVVRQGHFLGGVIAPGIETGMQTLVGRTARLPQVAIEVPDKATGRTTEAAINSGLLLGHVGMMEYIVKRIRQEEDMPQARVIATGGWSQVLGGMTGIVQAYHPDLTLEGLDWFAKTRLM